MWHKISQQLSWKAAFAYEKNCCVNLLFFILLLASSLIIKLLGCSILFLGLGKKIRNVHFGHQFKCFRSFYKWWLFCPYWYFPLSLSLSLPGRCIIYFQPFCHKCCRRDPKVANFWIWKLYIAWKVIISLYVCRAQNYIM